MRCAFWLHYRKEFGVVVFFLVFFSSCIERNDQLLYTKAEFLNRFDSILEADDKGVVCLVSKGESVLFLEDCCVHVYRFDNSAEEVILSYSFRPSRCYQYTEKLEISVSVDFGNSIFVDDELFVVTSRQQQSSIETAVIIAVPFLRPAYVEVLDHSMRLLYTKKVTPTDCYLTLNTACNDQFTLRYFIDSNDGQQRELLRTSNFSIDCSRLVE